MCYLFDGEIKLISYAQGRDATTRSGRWSRTAMRSVRRNTQRRSRCRNVWITAADGTTASQLMSTWLSDLQPATRISTATTWKRYTNSQEPTSIDASRNAPKTRSQVSSDNVDNVMRCLRLSVCLSVSINNQRPWANFYEIFWTDSSWDNSSKEAETWKGQSTRSLFI